VNVSTGVWVATLVVMVAVLAVDLLVVGRRPHEPGMKEAGLWVGLYVALALAFGLGVWLAAGPTPAGEFYAGWLTEYSLSVDNLFVFVIIMTTFAVPAAHQQRVLTFGIVLALAFRVVFILLGAALLSLFSVMFLVFGLILIYTAIQLYRHRDQDPDADNALVRATRRIVPITDDYRDGKLFTRENGKRVATPLFVVLVAIGSTDLLFALDSIPAVFGVTSETYIVFAANAFALLGLRALFFLVKGLLDRLIYLSSGLALILAFIGVKLALHWAHEDISTSVWEISTNLSLVVIAVVLTVTTIASLVAVRRDPSKKAHAGSLRAHRDRREPE